MILSATYSSTSFFNPFSVFTLNGSMMIIPFVSSTNQITVTEIVSPSLLPSTYITFVSDYP